jgi:hypothetical protein
MKTEQPIIRDDEEHRILRFVPRTSTSLPDHPATPASRSALKPTGDLSRYQQSAEPDDFRHRMLANAAAFTFTALLVGAGIWLAVTIADLRKTQDCVLMGRRDCARIATPHP